MKRLFVAVTVAALVLLPGAAAVAKRGGGSQGNRGGSGHHYGWDKQSPSSQRAPGARDRSIESGGSYPQGHSTSDPDGMSNGGADKPGGTGGIDRTDQDGNNGCGNDADFEDDNNGNCGGGHEKANGDVAVESEQAAPIGTWEAVSAVRSFAILEAPIARREAAKVLAVVVPPPLPAVEAAAAGSSSVPATVVQAIPHAVNAVARDVGSVGSSLGGLLPLTGMQIALLVAAGVALTALGVAIRRAVHST